jgi:chaperonin cofactor prefoldin
MIYKGTILVKKDQEYYAQLKNRIYEMEAFIEVLRKEIGALQEQKELLLQLISMLKRNARDLLF